MTITVLGLSADRTPSFTWSTACTAYVPEPGTDRLTDPFEGIDPRFVFDFQQLRRARRRPPTLEHLARASSRCAAAPSRAPTGS